MNMLQPHCSAQLSEVRKYGCGGKKVKMAMMEHGRNCNLAQKNSMNQHPLTQANCLGQMTGQYKKDAHKGTVLPNKAETNQHCR